jgi:hypothetical protein
MILPSLEFGLAIGEDASTYQILTAQQTSLSQQGPSDQSRTPRYTYSRDRDTTASFAIANSIGACLMTTASRSARDLIEPLMDSQECQ